MVLQDLDTIRSFAAAVAQATAFCARLAQTDELATIFSNPQFKVCCVVYYSSAGLIPALAIHYNVFGMTSLSQRVLKCTFSSAYVDVVEYKPAAQYSMVLRSPDPTPCGSDLFTVPGQAGMAVRCIVDEDTACQEVEPGG